MKKRMESGLKFYEAMAVSGGIYGSRSGTDRKR
jgi:hypothetical protein